MDTDPVLRCQVQQVVREAQNKLNTSDDANEIQLTLQGMTSLLPGGKFQRTLAGIPGDKLCEASRVFMDRHYVMFVECLLGRLTADWTGVVLKGQTEALFDAFFLQGAPVDSFIVLCAAITGSSCDSKLRKCQSLLERMLRGECFDEILWQRCNNKTRSSETRQEIGKLNSYETRSSEARQDSGRLNSSETRQESGNLNSSETRQGSGRVSSYECQLQERLVTLIATLPDRITGNLQAHASKFFFPSAYVPAIAKKIIALLKKLHNQLRTSQDCSMAFLSHLLGRMCITGHGEAIWSSLLNAFVPLTSDDFIWRRLVTALVTGVPDHCLESVLVPLVKQAPWHGFLRRVLGQQVLTNQKLQYILTNKLLLLRHFSQDLVLQNIIGYLATSSDTVSLYTKVFKKLLQVWGSASALQHTSYDQHVYITKAILISISFLDQDTKATIQDELLSELLPGLQCHLDSTLVRVRTLGMIVGESLTATIDSHGHKLSFQYEENEETRGLKALLIRHEDPGWNQQDESDVVSKDDDPDARTEDVIVPSCDTKKGQTEEPLTSPDDTQLDSDDDFEPYDMTHDVKVDKVKAPRYIRECLEGLVCSDDNERVAVCLGVTEQLVRQHPSSAVQNAVELTKVLLHLQASGDTSTFVQHRFRAMVALAVTAPVEAADYLCREFYERNYNLRQRMDMLEVLSAAAQELSQPDTSPHLQKSIEPRQPMSPGTEDRWREIVQRRIDSKTRRFGKGGQKPKATPTLNRFTAVAGHFFFPLIANFDHKETTLDLLDRDHLVLGRLLYTLGIILHAAASLPVVSHMAKVLLELVWCLRYHSQPSIRQALLFAVTMVVLSVPSHYLLSDLQEDMTETRGWLQDVAQQDVDQECRKAAMQALGLLQHNIQQELQSQES